LSRARVRYPEFCDLQRLQHRHFVLPVT
jgi:hypothetical protein